MEIPNAHAHAHEAPLDGERGVERGLQAQKKKEKDLDSLKTLKNLKMFGISCLPSCRDFSRSSPPLSRKKAAGDPR